MHLLGYRVSSCTAQELTMDGRNYVAAAFMWLCSLVIGGLVPIALIWLVVHRHDAGVNLSAGASVAVFVAALLFALALLMPFVFFDGIVRRTIRLCRTSDSVTIVDYIASGRHRSRAFPLKRPAGLDVKVFAPRGGPVGPLWSIQAISLTYPHGDPVVLLGHKTPTMRAESRQSKEIVTALQRWLDLSPVA
ncbi:hypothetical protein [Dyella terrae]|uniref:hypothetical protein n=1 Tax=Dyella terrae TaxID=522259 RepID=UPI001EFD3300|nr:hypothetical protein [Dyella terrae]